MRVLGAVLAGGASSRFGSDKAMAVVAGATLLEHARRALAPFVDTVVIVGRGDVDDVPRSGLGPLGGICGALDHAMRHGFETVMTIGCDMPAVPAGLLAALRTQAPSYCGDAPVLGHWPVDLADGLLDRLRVPATIASGKDGRLSVRRWAVGIGAVAIPSPAPLRNINTPSHLSPS